MSFIISTLIISIDFSMVNYKFDFSKIIAEKENYI